MPSFQSKVNALLLRLSREKDKVNHTRERVETGQTTHTKPSHEMHRRFRITTEVVNRHPVYTISPKERTGCKHIYYLHGGAYVNGFGSEHWRFVSWLINALGCTVTAPDYPLPPSYDVDDVFAMVLPLYERLAANTELANLTIMGDSAGGGLTLALAQKLRDEGFSQPANLILLSPWLDLTMNNPEIRKIDKVDPFLGVEGLIDAGKLYTNGKDLTCPLVSPIYGSLYNLGKITLFIGTHDILWADAKKLKAKAKEENVEIAYYEYQDMVHNWMLTPLPEAKQVMKQIVEKVNSHY